MIFVIFIIKQLYFRRFNSGYENTTLIFLDKIFKNHFELKMMACISEKYTDMYVTAPEEFISNDNVIYLTLICSSRNTIDILNILDKYIIKATFFVTGNESEQE